ncbi:hypothetical protein GCM10008090_26640 [Arenicella chitinivorans]|uniref:Sugar transporter n=1 Tax=Arenicella chitinivorans TaxID=1329800 RepID=A0A918RY07_9GAMM|nr:hypothetical protein [Arenicella chitinivorans]GHA15732.1 hypothetical protein GCM10008090_26640 [Arenicella chitinivorans]
MTSSKNAVSTPWHLWLIGILAVAWFAMGCFDFIMTQTQNEGYMQNFTEAQQNYFYSFPFWAVAVWAISVWGGLIASILLLMRNKLAAPIYLASIITYLLACLHNFLLTNGADFMGTAGLIMTVIILLIAIALYFYSRAQIARGVLR